ncbi:unnamed protein product [Leptosia nina]|uniref:Uncharacterized protein n=1 Tax=Leptosia nina TaxID=320188 RepID=A0AAV1J1R4_9NEOP
MTQVPERRADVDLVSCIASPRLKNIYVKCCQLRGKSNADVDSSTITHYRLTLLTLRDCRAPPEGRSGPVFDYGAMNSTRPVRGRPEAVHLSTFTSRAPHDWLHATVARGRSTALTVQNVRYETCTVRRRPQTAAAFKR